MVLFLPFLCLIFQQTFRFCGKNNHRCTKNYFNTNGIKIRYRHLKKRLIPFLVGQKEISVSIPSWWLLENFVLNKNFLVFMKKKGCLCKASLMTFVFCSVLFSKTLTERKLFLFLNKTKNVSFPENLFFFIQYHKKKKKVISFFFCEKNTVNVLKKKRKNCSLLFECFCFGGNLIQNVE